MGPSISGEQLSRCHGLPWGARLGPTAGRGSHASAFWLEINPPWALICLLHLPYQDKHQIPDFALGSRRLWEGCRPFPPKHGRASLHFCHMALERAAWQPLAGLHKSPQVHPCSTRVCSRTNPPFCPSAEPCECVCLCVWAASVAGQEAVPPPSAWGLLRAGAGLPPSDW